MGHTSPAAAPEPLFSCSRLDADDGAVSVVAAGALDLATAPQLVAVLGGVADRRRVTLDLRELDFMDCSGLRVVMATHARVSHGGGRLVVVREGVGSVERLFSVLGVGAVLDVSDTLPVWATRDAA